MIPALSMRADFCESTLSAYVVETPTPLEMSVGRGGPALFKEFKEKWETHVPSTVKCLEKSLEACLTFFNIPQEEWISLRTTNFIERLNKEFRRSTRPTEILSGEQSCYTLFACIALKMELHWRSNALGKVAKNLPLWKQLEG